MLSMNGFSKRSSEAKNVKQKGRCIRFVKTSLLPGAKAMMLQVTILHILDFISHENPTREKYAVANALMNRAKRAYKSGVHNTGKRVGI